MGNRPFVCTPGGNHGQGSADSMQGKSLARKPKLSIILIHCELVWKDDKPRLDYYTI